MKYLRCKCGKQTCMTSMGTLPCQGCKECKTTYAEHPDHHEELQPHKWVTKYNIDTGKPYKMCDVCYAYDEKSYKEAQA